MSNQTINSLDGDVAKRTAAILDLLDVCNDLEGMIEYYTEREMNPIRERMDRARLVIAEDMAAMLQLHKCRLTHRQCMDLDRLIPLIRSGNFRGARNIFDDVTARWYDNRELTGIIREMLRIPGWTTRT